MDKNDDLNKFIKLKKEKSYKNLSKSKMQNSKILKKRTSETSVHKKNPISENRVKSHNRLKKSKTKIEIHNGKGVPAWDRLYNYHKKLNQK